MGFKNMGFMWSAAEDHVLRTASYAGKTSIEAALLVNEIDGHLRTAKACRERALKIGIKLTKPRRVVRAASHRGPTIERELRNVHLSEQDQFWKRAAKADTKFHQLMLAKHGRQAVAPTSEPGTKSPKFMIPDTGVRSSGGQL